MSILDHIGVNVSSYPRSKAFYEKALAPLGIEVVREYGTWCGMGRGTPVHLSFVARSRAEVDAFYAAAIAAGGKDNGKPGVRKEYHPNYYGAFVIDPDGHNVEAVIHTA